MKYQYFFRKFLIWSAWIFGQAATGVCPALAMPSSPTMLSSGTPVAGLVTHSVALPASTPVAIVAPIVDSQNTCVQNTLAKIAAALIQPELSPQAIAALISQLGSEIYSERGIAQELLYRLGPLVLDALDEAAVESQDAEIRRSASELGRMIRSTGYDRAFRAVIPNAQTIYRMTPDLLFRSVKTIIGMELTIQIESSIPGLTVRLRNNADAQVEQFVYENDGLHLAQPFIATFSNGAPNNIKIILQHTPVREEDADYSPEHLLFSLPVTISLGCLPAAVNTTLVFEIETVQVSYY